MLLLCKYGRNHRCFDIYVGMPIVVDQYLHATYLDAGEISQSRHDARWQSPSFLEMTMSPHEIWLGLTI